MPDLLHIEAKSADALIDNEVAVLNFLPAYQADPPVSIQLSVRVLERLQKRIGEALERRRAASGRQ
jgi:hypothetical protein